jgi:hypothetical protein
MAKADLVQKALQMELGTQESLEGLKVAELEALIAANSEAGSPDTSKKAETEDFGADPRTGKEVEFQVEFGDGEIGKQDVFCAVNGHTVNIKRGQKVKGDKWIVDHLKSVSSEITESVVDKNGIPTGETMIRSVPRFNVTVY